MNLAVVTDLLASMIRITTPILLMALGGMMCERVNVFNIALEGMALVGAFFSIAFVQFSGGSVVVGLFGGMLSGFLYAALFGLFILKFKANHIITSIALNTLASGLTQFLLRAMFDVQGTYKPDTINKLQDINIPGLNKVPILGAISGQSIVTYIAVVMVILLAIFLKRTKRGLRFWSVGESENAARTAGINPVVEKWKATLFSGIMCGLAGGYLSCIIVSSFTKEMIAGRGFTAFTAYTFGGAMPVGSALASMLFGFAEAVGIRIELLGASIPTAVINMFPYFVAIIALGFSSYSRKRKIIGI